MNDDQHTGDDTTVTVILSHGGDLQSGTVIGVNHDAGKELEEIELNPDATDEELRAATAGMAFISQAARERLAGQFEDSMSGLEFDDRMRVVATDRQVDQLAACLYLQSVYYTYTAVINGERPPQISVEQAWEVPSDDVKDAVREIARDILDRVREVEP